MAVSHSWYELPQFIKDVRPTSSELEFFQALPWARQHIVSGHYHVTRFFSILPKTNPNADRFFSRLLGSEQAVNNSLMLIRNTGFGQPPKLDGKNVPQVPDLLLFVHMGPDVDGFGGVTHGGVLSTLLDEAISIVAECHRAASPNRSTSTIFTANLSVDFRAPVETPCTVALRVWLVEAGERKWKLRGQIENSEGKALCEANALFVASKKITSLKL